MASWDKVRIKVEDINSESPTGKSNYKRLNQVIDWAEAMDIDPQYAERSNLSNLREIIGEAKRAIKKSNKNRVSELFRWASKLTTTELRIKLRGGQREEIKVVKIFDGKEKRYILNVSEEQLKRIEKSMVLFYSFNIQED